MQIDWVQATVIAGRLPQLEVHVQPPEGADPDDTPARSVYVTDASRLQAAAAIIAALITERGLSAKAERGLPCVVQFRRDISHEELGSVQVGASLSKIKADNATAADIHALLDALAGDAEAEVGTAVAVRVAVKPKEEAPEGESARPGAEVFGVDESPSEGVI